MLDFSHWSSGQILFLDENNVARIYVSATGYIPQVQKKCQNYMLPHPDFNKILMENYKQVYSNSVM